MPSRAARRHEGAHVARRELGQRGEASTLRAEMLGEEAEELADVALIGLDASSATSAARPPRCASQRATSRRDIGGGDGQAGCSAATL